MATIKDVARESGVSVATVSYVLNDGPRPVRPQTRERVLDAMRRLNYHPNAMARGLARRRMYTVGVLFGRIETAIVSNAYASAILEGVLAAAAELDYNVTLFPKPWVNVRHSAGPFRDRRTDGALIIAPQQDSDIVPGLATLGLPLVVVSAVTDQHGVPFFDADNRIGGHIATEHLLSLGHTRIAHVTGSGQHSSVPSRQDGWCRALKNAGIMPRPEYVVQGDYSGKGAEDWLRTLLALPEPPTAIFAGNDIIAIRLLEAAWSLGIRIPEQLSLIGFDNVPAAAMVRPSLTTVHQPLAEMGGAALRLLVRIIEEKGATRNSVGAHLYAPTLVERNTTAPPASSETMRRAS
ncbi:MAG: LacI family DNA-binding transcriptional regulator [Armatimonadaceae bacterium]